MRVGEKVPEFSLFDQNKIQRTNKDLKTPLVLFFYPKDDTPGCTIEVCGFRDKYDLFKDKPIKKYIFCTTNKAEIDEEVKSEILRIHTEHGCDIMILNLYDYIFKLLTLIESLDEILENYVILVKKDEAVQFHQKKLLQDYINVILN